MNGKEYLEVQMTLVEIGKKVEALDLDSFLSEISQAEATGPILDPTLYRRALRNIQAIKQLAEAFQKVKEIFPNVRDAVIETTLAALKAQGNDDPSGNCDECSSVPPLDII